MFICIFKIGPIETVELMFTFDQKKLVKNLQSTFGYRKTFGELCFFNNWLFVPSYKIEKALGFRFLFDSLIKFKLQKKNITTNKHNKTEIYDHNSQQLSLILKSFLRIRENENFVVKADFRKIEIGFEHYYKNIDDFCLMISE